MVISSAQPATNARPILRRSESDGPRQPPGSWFDCWRCPTEPLARARIRAHRCPRHDRDRRPAVRPRRRCLLLNAPAPSYGFVVALKFVAFERDKKVGQIAFCDRDRSANHCLTTNWQLHWTQLRTGFGLLPRCNGRPQLEPDVVERSGRLATSSGLTAGAVSIQRSLSRFARSASGSTPTKCDALPRATHWFAETTGTRFKTNTALAP